MRSQIPVNSVHLSCTGFSITVLPCSSPNRKSSFTDTFLTLNGPPIVLPKYTFFFNKRMMPTYWTTFFLQLSCIWMDAIIALPRNSKIVWVLKQFFFKSFVFSIVRGLDDIGTESTRVLPVFLLQPFTMVQELKQLVNSLQYSRYGFNRSKSLQHFRMWH